MSTQNQILFADALRNAYAELFATDADYAYSASKTTPEGLADRMVNAFITGSGSHTGKGVQMACKACEISHTAKAVFEFVGYVAPQKPAKVLKTASNARKVTTIGLSNIHALMTGVSRIDRAADLRPFASTLPTGQKTFDPFAPHGRTYQRGRLGKRERAFRPCF